jgi:hypothetical protein
MQHDDAHHEHVGMLSVAGGMKVLEGDYVIVLECQNQLYIDVEENSPFRMDSAPEMPAFNCVTLFLFALMHQFCCIAHGRLLVCHAHSYVIMCDWPY